MAAQVEITDADMLNYMQFVAETGRSVGSTDEMKQRVHQFKKTQEAIDHHNSMFEAGRTMYTKSHNQFSDDLDIVHEELDHDMDETAHLEEEVKAVHGMSHEERAEHHRLQSARSSAPATHDWTANNKINYISAVKNEGTVCTGAGWAFAATAMLEAAFTKGWKGKIFDTTKSTWKFNTEVTSTTKDFVSFSEQQMLDCTK
jgi:hypothetical protein